MTKDPRFDPKVLNNQKNQRKKDKIVGKEISNTSILTEHLSNNSIVTDKIADSNITNSKLAVGSVTTSKIADGSINSSKIADGSINSSKIADQSITDAKMTTALQQRLANNFIKKQIVNRRPIITEAVGPSSLITFNIYGPFSYNVPPVQDGAERRFRIYAVYSDNVSITAGLTYGVSSMVAFDMVDNGVQNNPSRYGYNQYSPRIGDHNFYLFSTSGDSATYRDAVSNEIVGNLSGGHAEVRISPFDDATGRTIKILYMEIQCLDVFP